MDYDECSKADDFQSKSTTLSEDVIKSRSTPKPPLHSMKQCRRIRIKSLPILPERKKNNSINFENTNSCKDINQCLENVNIAEITNLQTNLSDIENIDFNINPQVDIDVPLYSNHKSDFTTDFDGEKCVTNNSIFDKNQEQNLLVDNFKSQSSSLLSEYMLKISTPKNSLSNINTERRVRIKSQPILHSRKNNNSFQSDSTFPSKDLNTNLEDNCKNEKIISQPINCDRIEPIESQVTSVKGSTFSSYNFNNKCAFISKFDRVKCERNISVYMDTEENSKVDDFQSESSTSLSEDVIKSRSAPKPTIHKLSQGRRIRIKSQPILPSRKRNNSIKTESMHSGEDLDSNMETSNKTEVNDTKRLNSAGIEPIALHSNSVTDIILTSHINNSRSILDNTGTSHSTKSLTSQPSIITSKSNTNLNVKKSIKNEKLSQMNLKNSPVLKSLNVEDLLKDKIQFYERKLDFKKKISEGNFEKDKMTMFDLIYWNPATNPMPGRKDKQSRSRSSSINDSRMSVSEFSKIEQEVEERGLVSSDKNGSSNKAEASDSGVEDEEPVSFTPQIKIGPNGDIIIDERSVMIETTAAKNRDDILRTTEVVEEENESSHYGKYSKRRKRSTEWTKKETARFYKALSSVGTDFSLMTTVFHWRSRAELKIKFKKEEKINRHLIDCALNDCTQFDFSIFEESDYDPVEDRKLTREEDKARYKAKKRLENQQKKLLLKNEKKIRDCQGKVDNLRKRKLRKLNRNSKRRKKYRTSKHSREIQADSFSSTEENADRVQTKSPETQKSADKANLQSLSNQKKKKDKDECRKKSLSTKRSGKGNLNVDTEEIVYEIVLSSSNKISDDSKIEENKSMPADEEMGECQHNEQYGEESLYNIDINCTSPDGDPSGNLAAKSLLELFNKCNVPALNYPHVEDRDSPMLSPSLSNHDSQAQSKKLLLNPQLNNDILSEIYSSQQDCERNSLVNSVTTDPSNENLLFSYNCSKQRYSVSPVKEETPSSSFNVEDSSLIPNLIISGDLTTLVPLNTNQILNLEQCKSVTSIPISIDTELYSKMCSEMNLEQIDKRNSISSLNESPFQQSVHNVQTTENSEPSQFCVPVSDVQKSCDGSQFIQINSKMGIKKITVPPFNSATTSIVVMMMSDPDNPLENIYHVYTVAPIQNNSSSDTSQDITII